MQQPYFASQEGRAFLFSKNRRISFRCRGSRNPPSLRRQIKPHWFQRMEACLVIANDIGTLLHFRGWKGPPSFHF
jgi:hypothetical protein